MQEFILMLPVTASGAHILGVHTLLLTCQHLTNNSCHHVRSPSRAPWTLHSGLKKGINLLPQVTEGKEEHPGETTDMTTKTNDKKRDQYLFMLLLIFEIMAS